MQMEYAADADLVGIVEYISQKLKEPQIAKRIYFSIKAQIATLDINPLRNQIVDDEPYRSQGVRKLHAENYTAFYVVDENKHEVHVLRVLYNRREWQPILNCK